MFPDIRLSSTFGISTYFLIISIACTLAALWFVKRAEQRRLERLTAIDLTLTCLVTGFLGARLAHIFYEEPYYYQKNWMAAFEVWNGGFVFLAGLVAAWIGAAVFCNLKREPFWFWADTAAPAASLGYALGRLGCFFNGCCFGKECQLPWAVEMHGVFRHPTQLYASFWELGWLGILLALEPRLKTSGLLFNIWLLGHAAGRILMEIYRADPRGDLIHGVSLGIWMSLALSAFALLNLLSVRFQKGAGA